MIGRTLALCLLVLAALAVACGGDDATTTPGAATATTTVTSGVTSSPTASPTLFGTYTPTATPTPSEKQVQTYRNATYAYSFSVSCPPFCGLDETALDTFRAVSSDGQNAWIEAKVTNLADGDKTTLDAFHASWKTEMASLAAEFKETGSKETFLVDRTTPALQIEWTARSAGGEQPDLQATTILSISGALGYALSVAAPASVDAELQDDLALTLKTFNVEGGVDNVPGVFDDYGFVFKHPSGWEAAAAGGADNESGQFRAGVRPPGPAVVVLLTWSTVAAKDYDPVADIDRSITNAQKSSQTYKTIGEFEAAADSQKVNYFLYQDALEDGRAIFAGFGEWFCPDSSRVFTMDYLTDTKLDEAQLKERFESFLTDFRCAVEAP